MATRASRFTTAELIGFQVDALIQAQRLAANERRGHADTERLIDDLDTIGRTLRRIGRG